MYWFFIVLTQKRRKKDTKNILWSTNSPSDDFIPTFLFIYMQYHYVPRKTKALLRFCLVFFSSVGEGTERRRKQGPELLSPMRALTWSSPGATRDVFHPPSPTSGSAAVPQRLHTSQLPGITRASGRKLHSIIKGVFAAYTLVYVFVHRSTKILLGGELSD